MKKPTEAAWYRQAYRATAIVTFTLLAGLAPRAAHAACVGDCNADAQVTVNELIMMVNIALGNADVSTCTPGDANGDGGITVNEIVTAVNNALNGCPPEAGFCGDGVVNTDQDEDCDDGGICIGGSKAGTPCTSEAECGGDSEKGVCLEGPNAQRLCSADSECPGSTCVRCRTFGGDGCSANCTNETEVATTLVSGEQAGLEIVPGTSGLLVNAIGLTLPLPLVGTQTFIVGRERNGRIAVALKPEGLQLERIPVQALVCACIRGTGFKTCGGTQLDADGQPSINCTPGETAGESKCAGLAPCTYVFGPGNSGAGVIGCASLNDVNFSTTQDGCESGPCDGLEGMSGPVITERLPGVGGPGSMLLYTASAIGIGVGLCTGTDASIVGPDGEFCTDDDPQIPDDAASPRGLSNVQLLTTGTATAFVANANLFAGEDNGPFSATGNPVACSDVASGTLSGLALAGAFTALEQPAIGDIVVNSTFVTQ
ncbi:MAG: hypothetical protein ACE5I7_01535 [Candidatus Binatia bacterium]